MTGHLVTAQSYDGPQKSYLQPRFKVLMFYFPLRSHDHVMGATFIAVCSISQSHDGSFRHLVFTP